MGASDDEPIRELAMHLINELNVDAPLSVVQERVWMLKTRNVPDSQIQAIILSEFGGDSSRETEAITFEPGDESQVINLEDWR